MNSIRWKLMLGTLVVVFIPVWLLNRYALEFFDRYTRVALEDQMKNTAFIVGEQYKTFRSHHLATNQFRAFLATCTEQGALRISLLSPNGDVLFDTAAGADNLVGTNLATRREVARALGGEYGARHALTPDRQYMYYYCASPVLESNQVVAVAYTVRHTAPIIGAIKRLLADQKVATALAAGAALLVAGLLAQTLTHRLRKLSQAAVAYARGQTTWQSDIHGKDEIGKLARAVGTMASELEQRNRYNRDFISTTMHELKTPLTAVKGAVEILEEGAADHPPSRQRFLANIRHEVVRMIRLVGELNELTKLDVEMLRGEKRAVDYVQFVREVVTRLEPTFERQDTRLVVSLPDGSLPTLIVPGRIEQVIANLLENAFRYTPPGGAVELGVIVGEDLTILTMISDSGPGIAPSNLPRVFDRFFTTESKDDPYHLHSGLGLAIARTIVENHHGQLRAENRAGGGARFTFSLPLA